MKYNQLTSSDTLLSCLRASDVKQCGKKWLKAFRNILHRSFKKVRITNKKLEQEEVHRLMRAKTQVLEKIEEMKTDASDSSGNILNQTEILVSQEAVDSLDLKISEICSEKKEHYKDITDISGSFNLPKMWGLRKKLNFKAQDVPSAKKDQSGNLITTKNGILALYRKTYMDRLSPKPIREEYEELRALKENLFNLRYP